MSIKRGCQPARARAIEKLTSRSDRWAPRIVAAFMLAILLPTSVFAAPLLYCVNGDGHRAVEFVHAKDRVHEEISFEHVQSVDVSHIEPHVLGSHCRDRVLLPDIAKPEACRIAAPSPQPHVVPLFHQRSESALARRCVLSANSVLETVYPDPRLVALRTVVLLN